MLRSLVHEVDKAIIHSSQNPEVLFLLLGPIIKVHPADDKVRSEVQGVYVIVPDHCVPFLASRVDEVSRKDGILKIDHRINALGVTNFFLLLQCLPRQGCRCTGCHRQNQLSAFSYRVAKSSLM